MSFTMMSIGFRTATLPWYLPPTIPSTSAFSAGSWRRWCSAVLKRLKQAAQGTITSCGFFSAAIRSRAGRAIESLKFVACAELAPQQDQSSISSRSIPRLRLTALTDWSYSLAVPCSEDPG